MTDLFNAVLESARRRYKSACETMEMAQSSDLFEEALCEFSTTRLFLIGLLEAMSEDEKRQCHDLMDEWHRHFMRFYHVKAPRFGLERNPE